MQLVVFDEAVSPNEALPPFSKNSDHTLGRRRQLLCSVAAVTARWSHIHHLYSHVILL